MDELVHSTQLPAALHTGVAPGQSAFIRQPTHTPIIPPVALHFCDRQTWSPFPCVQGPSPLA